MRRIVSDDVRLAFLGSYLGARPGVRLLLIQLQRHDQVVCRRSFPVVQGAITRDQVHDPLDHHIFAVNDVDLGFQDRVTFHDVVAESSFFGGNDNGVASTHVAEVLEGALLVLVPRPRSDVS